MLPFGTAALVLFASPPVAEPQHPTNILRVVALNPSGGPQEQQRVFRQALRELGYIEGENILIEDRFAAGRQERLREYAAEAVRLKVDVILAISSSAIHVSTKATKRSQSSDSISNPTLLRAASSPVSPAPATTSPASSLISQSCPARGSSYSRKRSQRLPPSPFCGIPAWTRPSSARSRSPPTRWACSCKF